MGDRGDKSGRSLRAVPSDVLLQSWKEIANHLGVSVRTAQEWEKVCGLPVYREGVSKRSRIIAHSRELDEWREARRIIGSEIAELKPVGQNDAPSPAREAAASPEPVSFSPLPNRLIFRRPWLLPGVALLIAAIGVLTWFALMKPGPPVKWRMDGNVLGFFDARDRFCWGLDFPRYGLNPGAYTPTPPYRLGPVWRIGNTLIEDLDGDGRREIVVSGRISPREQDALLCLEENGELRWRYLPGRPLEWRGRHFDSFTFQYMSGPVSVLGRRYLLVCARDHSFFPFQLALVDVLTGEASQEYWHPGDLGPPHFLDSDKDGQLEIAMAATNNPGEGPGHSAFVVLDLPFRNPRPGLKDVFGNPAGREKVYIAFPRIDVVDLKREWSAPKIELISDTGRIRILVIPPTIQDHSQWARYELDFSFRVVDFQIFGSFRERHRALEREGVLDHPLTQAEIDSWRVVKYFEAVPDGNSPEVNDLWSTPRPLP